MNDPDEIPLTWAEMENWKNAIAHHESCSADYPEKPEGESPQHVDRMALPDDEVIYTCSDCGAFVIRTEPSCSHGKKIFTEHCDECPEE